MELIAVATRDGEPVACAYGCVRSGRDLRAGMLFVQAGQTDQVIEFEDPTTQERILLQLPKSALNLSQDGRAYQATLSTPDAETP